MNGTRGLCGGKIVSRHKRPLRVPIASSTQVVWPAAPGAPGWKCIGIRKPRNGALLRSGQDKCEFLSTLNSEPSTAFGPAAVVANMKYSLPAAN
jgi:hypothetical protein